MSNLRVRWHLEWLAVQPERQWRGAGMKLLESRV